MTMNRREFLQLLGISTASAALGFKLPRLASTLTADNTPLLARKLGASPVMPTPIHPSIADRYSLHPTDTVSPILGVEGDFLRLPDGYIHPSRVQPILREDYHPPTSLTVSSMTFPTWVTVAAPSARIHKQADTTSFQVKRVGHGGILKTVDFLPPASPNSPSWAALADNTGKHIGWSQAHLWRVVNFHEVASNDSRWALIDPTSKHIHIYQRDQEVFSAPCLPSEWMLQGDYTIGVKTPGVTAGGAPYALTLQHNSAATRDILITGAYWHNHFDSTDDVQSNDVHLTIHAARVLYAFAPIGMQVTVI